MIELLVFAIYLAIAATILKAAYGRINWEESNERGETILDVLACFSVSVFWPFYWFLGSIISVLKFTHNLLVRISR